MKTRFWIQRVTVCVLCALLVVACHRKPADAVAPLSNFNSTLPVTMAWSQSSGDGVDKLYIDLSPSVAGNAVYTTSHSGQVNAFNAQTGQRLWSNSLHTPVTTGVAVGDDKVYVGTKNAEVIALDRRTGKIVWKIPVSNEVLVQPNAEGNLLVVKTADDTLYALNKQTGATVWTYKEPPADIALRGGQAPQVVGNWVVAGFANGQVGVFTLNNGNLLWKHPIAEPKGLSIIEQMVDVNSLAVVDGVIYAATYQGALAAVGLHSGNILWQQELSAYSGLALDENAVYITDTDGNVYAFSRRSGELLWKQAKLYHRGVTGPAVVAGSIVVGDSKGYVHWLSARDGSFVARTHPDGKGIMIQPVARGNEVYIYTNSGRLIKYVVK